MNRIEALVAEHCPDGVQFKTLGEAGELIRGRRFTKADYVDDGLGSIHYGEVYTTYGTATSNVHRFVRKELRESLRLARTGDLVIAATGENVKEVGKAVAWLGPEDVAIHDDCYIFRHNLHPTYVSYFFQSSTFQDQKTHMVTDSKLARISGRNLAKIKIPVPPIEIQHEIASLLDKMEILRTELQSELQSELRARSSQYKFYRKQLLEFSGPDVEWSTLGEVATNLDSRRQPVTKGSRVRGNYPYYGANGVQDFVDSYIFDGAHLLMGEDGSVLNADHSPVVNWATGKFWVNNHAHVLAQRSPGVDLRFLYFYLQTIDARAYVSGTTQHKLNQGNLNRIPVPVPPLAEQERIVAILDKLDDLVIGLSANLPAEIEARRRQYEYHRDKFLTFPERPDAA